MNAIFAAQQLAVPIDACVFGKTDVPLLQQACLLAKGVYIKPDATSLERALVQALLMHFLADKETRELLRMPHQRSVDMRASCVCHDRLLDIGFVCSVCLSIYCERQAICDTCSVRFELPNVR